MHKKIIAAMGVAGFLMLSYVKVTYAVDYELALNAAETTTPYVEAVEEARLVQADSPVVMVASSQEQTDTQDAEEFVEETEESTENRTEEITEQATEKATEKATQKETQPITVAATEPVTEKMTEPVTEPITETVAEIVTEKEPTVAEMNSAALAEMVLAEYNPASARVVNVTKNEYDILLRIVEAEATGKDVLSKMLVASVILNRVNNRSFPGSIEGVVFQKNGNVSQFSPMDDGRYYSVNISAGTTEAVNRVLAGEDYSQGALYFAAEWIVNGRGCWASRHFNEVFRYEGHVFFAP